MSKFTLEVCADSVESVLAAQKGGADRIELCGNVVIGGTTPSESLYREIRKHSDIKIHALIRPRFGDFCYTEYEFNIIRAEVKRFRELGAQGVVIGMLKPDGSLDMEHMKMLMEEADGMSVTLHRAFDVCKDPMEALEQAVSLGINTILTSGQKNNCVEGTPLLAELVKKSAGRIHIMAGAGVNAEAVSSIYEKTGITDYHMTGKIVLESEMQYRKEGVNMGLPSLSEFEIFRTSEQEVRKARNVLNSYC
ncbi:copper homeostasis protein CutC [Blautia sp. HCP3S3_H10_1]|uniref:copper homeostasis protein CutC n=1 Tax=unclassified Blautia TaxID=2648079 RepID=UPI003F8F5CD9|nr:copper homeostasis protein CutC [Clostridia bacterium]